MLWVDNQFLSSCPFPKVGFSVLLLAFYSLEVWHHPRLVPLFLPLKMHKENKGSPTLPQKYKLMEQPDGAAWRPGPHIKENWGTVIWRCSDRPLLLLPLSLILLPPSFPSLLFLLPSSALVTKLSAACSTVDTRTSLGMGCMAGMERKMERQRERTDRSNMKEKKRVGGVSQACQP